MPVWRVSTLVVAILLGVVSRTSAVPDSVLQPSVSMPKPQNEASGVDSSPQAEGLQKKHLEVQVEKLNFGLCRKFCSGGREREVAPGCGRD